MFLQCSGNCSGSFLSSKVMHKSTINVWLLSMPPRWSLQVLQVLDATVEIPQMGVVRSLNVHVSGALALYEYSRQRQNWGHADFPA